MPGMPFSKLRFGLVAGVILMACAGKVSAQSPLKEFPQLFTTPLTYVVGYTQKSVVLDGDLNDEAWQQAAWTSNFQDIEGSVKLAPTYQTRVKMLWNDSCLYIAAELKEPHVWATLKKHDDIIFNDNDFEVFIDPQNNTHQYYEFEVNALNTLFDLFLNKPYRNLGNAMINWNAAGFKSAVRVQGTLNNPTDTDEGWTVEMAIPFKALNLNNQPQAPAEGTTWRINFSRVEWDHQVINSKYTRATDKSGKRLTEHNWVWSAQGVVNMHFPERWGYLQFSKQPSKQLANAPLPYAEQQKQYLWLIYYEQRAYYAWHHRYAANLKELGIAAEVMVSNALNRLKMEGTSRQFFATIANDGEQQSWAINHDGLIHWISKP